MRPDFRQAAGLAPALRQSPRATSFTTTCHTDHNTACKLFQPFFFLREIIQPALGFIPAVGVSAPHPLGDRAVPLHGLR